MINFRIYNMNEHELLATRLTREEAVAFINKEENKNKRIMAVKYDTEKKQGDEIVNISEIEGYLKLKDMSCIELKREIVKRK